MRVLHPGRPRDPLPKLRYIIMEGLHKPECEFFFREVKRVVNSEKSHYSDVYVASSSDTFNARYPADSSIPLYLHTGNQHLQQIWALIPVTTGSEVHVLARI